LAGAGAGVKHIAAFGRFWWDFVIGDDWLAAAGVAAALAVTALVATWWILPPAVAIVLAASLRRATAHS
jgi:CBS-domain-containing membrane protein